MASQHSINPKDFDITVKPSDDFFQFVNGKWLKENPIPPEEANWGSFYVLRREADEQLKVILEEVTVIADAKEGSDEQKIRDFYVTAMDVAKCNALGVAPLAGIFKVVDEVTDGATLARAAGQLHRWGIHPFWSPFIEQDEKQSDVVAVHLYQGGLSLPDRDYYLNEDEKSREIREKYLKYVKALMSYFSVIPAQAGIQESGSMGPRLREDDDEMQTIMKIETRLAKASRTRVELRDIEKQYNKMTASELAAATPNIAWKEYFAGLTTSTPDYFIVGQPEFFKEVNRILVEIPLEDLKIYLRWHVLNSMTSCLTEEIEQQSFDFYARTFRGATEMKPRWRRVLGVMNGLLDEMLGKLYVKKHFSVDAKQKVNVLVDWLVAAYRVRIDALDWMSSETKAKAQEKLGSFSRKLGYPDIWRDFSALAIGTESYADNYLRACAFESDRQMKKIGKPVDRTEWLMPPQMVNAYYQPPMNEIAFPAAILQPPFFDPNADDAVNFGGIGSVIGHELTHGFDDQGALFDLQGNVKNWWTEEDKKRFDEKADRLAVQYDTFEPVPGVHVNGKLTLGENIADLGGLIIAYDAFHLAMAQRSKEEQAALATKAPIDGMTPEQRFFAAFAICERGHAREEYLRMQLQTDPHSPSVCRVNGPVSNVDEFYKAFDVKPGDKLWRESGDRVKIW